MVFLVLFFCFLLVGVPGIHGQTSDAVCLPYYQWTFNTQGKTPCEVASSLLAICNGGSFNVVALPDNQHYQGPTLVSNANPCMCNTVTFSLMSACGLCQGKSILRWSEWSENCPQVSLSSFPDPIPSGLRVPAWAYLDVKTSDTFDQFLAKADANLTESTAVPLSTPSFTSPMSTSVPLTSSTLPLVSTSTPIPTTEASGSNTSVKSASVVGGSIVGAILGCALVLGVIAYWMRRRRQRRNLIGEPLSSPIYGHHEEQIRQMQQHADSDTSLPSIRISTSASSQNRLSLNHQG